MSTSSSEIKKQLSALPFWGALTAREQETMCACAQIRCYAKGELIYSKEQECLGLIRVLSGAIRTFMLSDEGREVRLYRVDKNDTDVLSASCVMNQITFETQMVADSDCTLLIVPAVCLSSFKENMSLGSAAAFMITGPATKITNLGALKIVIGAKRFALYMVYVVLYSFLSGFLINLILYA